MQLALLPDAVTPHSHAGLGDSHFPSCVKRVYAL